MRFLKNGGNIWKRAPASAFKGRSASGRAGLPPGLASLAARVLLGCFLALLPALNFAQTRDSHPEAQTGAPGAVAGAAVTPAEPAATAVTVLDSPAPENLGLPNWQGDDYAPFLSPDGRFLLFQSDRPGLYEGQNLWYAENKNFADRLGKTDWTIPLPLTLPLAAAASPTMRITRPVGALDDPPGGFTPNTQGFEGMASYVFRGGQPVEVYFTAAPRDEGGRDGMAGLNIYFARYRDQRWSEVRHINEINSDFDDRMAHVSADGRWMYLVSNRPGGAGGYDLWIAERDLTTGQWSTPQNAGPAINTRYHEISPTLSPDGKTLFFSSDRPGGFGHYDIYRSRYTGQAWASPENLGEPVNSARDDEYAILSADGLWLYFASDRRDLAARGGLDLYRWPLPEWLRNPVDVLLALQILDGGTRRALGVEATVKIIYERGSLVERSRIFRQDPGDTYVNNYARKLESGRTYRIEVSAPGFEPQSLLADYRGALPAGALDSRTVYLKPIVEPGGGGNQPGGNENGGAVGERRTLRGVVVDSATNLPLPGSRVRLTFGAIVTEISVGREGEFRLEIPEGAEFRLHAEAPDYRSLERSYREAPALREIVLALDPIRQERPCPDGRPECIDNLRVYFDVNQSAVRASEAPALEAVARVLKAYPALRIEVRGHTDRTNTFEYNQRLSEARAAAVRAALVQLGVAGDRVVSRGFSYSQPLAPERTPADRALNRRVEFRRILPNTPAGDAPASGAAGP